jgi:hypothetical protein
MPHTLTKGIACPACRGPAHITLTDKGSTTQCQVPECRAMLVRLVNGHIDLGLTAKETDGSESEV